MGRNSAVANSKATQINGNGQMLVWPTPTTQNANLGHSSELTELGEIATKVLSRIPGMVIFNGGMSGSHRVDYAGYKKSAQCEAELFQWLERHGKKFAYTRKAASVRDRGHSAGEGRQHISREGDGVTVTATSPQS